MDYRHFKINPRCRYAVHLTVITLNFFLFVAFSTIFISHAYLVGKLIRNRSIVLIFQVDLFVRFGLIFCFSLMTARYHVIATIRSIRYLFPNFRNLTKNTNEILLSYLYCFLSAYLLIFAWYSLQNVEGEFRDGFKEAIMQYNVSSLAREAIDQVQKFYQCCGLTQWRDYFEFWRIDKNYEGEKRFILCSLTNSSCLPTSCCRFTDCSLMNFYKKTFNETIYEKGCVGVFGQDILSFLFLPILIAIMIILEIIAALLLNITYSAYAISDELKLKDGENVEFFLFPWPNLEAYMKKRNQKKVDEKTIEATTKQEKEFSRKRQNFFNKMFGSEFRLKDAPNEEETKKTNA